MRLDFAIVGAQKAATTSLHRALAASSRVVMPAQETPTFEDPYYSPIAVEELADALGDLRGDRELVGIRRPNYLTIPEVPGRLHAVAPRLKAIGVLRPPAQRAVSAYFHLMNHGHLPVRPAETVFDELLAGRWDQRFPRYGEILDFSTYAPGIRRYNETFGSDSTLWIDQADVRHDLRGALNRIGHLLGVEVDDPPPAGDANVGHYSTRRLRLFRAIADRSWERDGLVVTGHDRPLYRVARAIDQRLLGRLPSPPMQDTLSDAMWSRLHDHFADDIAEVKALTGIDLTAR